MYAQGDLRSGGDTQAERKESGDWSWHCASQIVRIFLIRLEAIYSCPEAFRNDAYVQVNHEDV